MAIYRLRVIVKNILYSFGSIKLLLIFSFSYIYIYFFFFFFFAMQFIYSYKLIVTHCLSLIRLSDFFG